MNIWTVCISVLLLLLVLFYNCYWKSLCWIEKGRLRTDLATIAKSLSKRKTLCPLPSVSKRKKVKKWRAWILDFFFSINYLLNLINSKFRFLSTSGLPDGAYSDLPLVSTSFLLGRTSQTHTTSPPFLHLKIYHVSMWERDQISCHQRSFHDPPLLSKQRIFITYHVLSALWQFLRLPMDVTQSPPLSESFVQNAKLAPWASPNTDRASRVNIQVGIPWLERLDAWASRGFIGFFSSHWTSQGNKSILFYEVTHLADILMPFYKVPSIVGGTFD